MEHLSLVAAVMATLPLALAQVPGSTREQPNKAQEAQEQVRKLEQDLVSAFAKGSKAAIAHLERVLAEEAIITETDGQARTRAHFLDHAKAGDRASLALEQKDLKTQAHGDTVIVTGRMVMKGPPEESIRYTHVYVKRQGQWQVVAAQYTAVRRP